jgi:hypothetical protein
MNVSDALVIAPMGLFFPQLLEPIEPYKPNILNTEDVYDNDFFEQSKVQANIPGKARVETQGQQTKRSFDFFFFLLLTLKQKKKTWKAQAPLRKICHIIYCNPWTKPSSRASTQLPVINCCYFFFLLLLLLF